MDKSVKGESTILGVRTAFMRKAWLNMTLLVLAVAMVGTGVYYSVRPQGANAEDVASYNQALSAYFSVEYIPPTDWDLAQYPIANLLRVAAYFQQAAGQSANNDLKSAALYNIGTVIGRDYLVFMMERVPGLGLTEAVSKLSEAVRIDPNNEDAKYNLEFLEQMQTMLQSSSSSPEALVGGAIMSPGIGFKGY